MYERFLFPRGIVDIEVLDLARTRPSSLVILLVGVDRVSGLLELLDMISGAGVELQRGPPPAEAERKVIPAWTLSSSLPCLLSTYLVLPASAGDKVQSWQDAIQRVRFVLCASSSQVQNRSAVKLLSTFLGII
jgi:hypothetical protein